MNVKKFLLIFVVIFAFATRSFACAWFDPDYEYYNLLMQEIIDDPQYFPFLLSESERFYKSDTSMKNENIEEWQHYLGISYENALYLVFKSTEKDLRALIKGQAVADAHLQFVTPDFVKRHKQALLYLAYAKYLEPCMAITKLSGEDGWGYYDDPGCRVDQLDYQKVINVLERSWKAETDKELKLRYGYQLVRFAHYNRMYEEAVRYFDEYVEPLNHKPAMYYHALAQKAGAERGMEDILSANLNFFKVFVNSRDLKTTAIISIRFTEDADFLDFLEHAETEKKRNDAYLLLGYFNFSDPLSHAEIILEQSPDAIQAKVLVARAINQIERNAMPTDFYYWGGKPASVEAGGDKRYPVLNHEIKSYAKETLALTRRMAQSSNVKDTNFWNLTSAYLCFLLKDYQLAKEMLDKVQGTNKTYEQQKQNLTMYIDISQHSRITSNLEMKFLTQYGDVFEYKSEGSYPNYYTPAYTSMRFMIDALANRYFLQKDYAKSFLMSNPVSELENNPQMELINEVESFYLKKDKNEWEKTIGLKANNRTELPAYCDYLRGIVYLTQGNLSKAYESFQKTAGLGLIPDNIFGYNQIECFDCPESMTMATDYLDDFDFIPSAMSFKELADVLLRLQKAGKGENADAVKANYLLGNFFYNVSATGYFRNLLRFSTTNGGNYMRYAWNKKPDIYDQIFFKYYPIYYENPVAISQQYLEQAYKQASDQELKTRIVFALSKCEQEVYYAANDISYGWRNKERILITNRTYFKEMMKYSQTSFFNEVQTHCKYFDYYVNHCASK